MLELAIQKENLLELQSLLVYQSAPLTGRHLEQLWDLLASP